MNDEVIDSVEASKPTQTYREYDYIFHAETENGYLLFKADAESKDEALSLAKAEFEEWQQQGIWNPDMPVYLGKFSYEYHGEDVDNTVERGEVIDFSSIQ